MSNGKKARKLPFAVPQSKPSRFSLDAPDAVDCLIGILIALHEGRRPEAEVAFQKLGLTPTKVKNWSWIKRSMAFYFLTRLTPFGLRLSDALFQLVSAWPPKVAVDSRSWHSLGMRKVGNVVPLVKPAVGYCWDYILWKQGLDHKPTTEPWSLVP